MNQKQQKLNEVLVPNKDFVAKILQENKNKKIKNFTDFHTIKDLQQHDGQLVEFTTMVQNIFDPEMYVSCVFNKKLISSKTIGDNQETKDSLIFNKYHDHNVIVPKSWENQENVISERGIALGLTIPNENNWYNKEKQEEKEQTIEEKSFIQIRNNKIDINAQIQKYSSILKKENIFEDENQSTFPCILKFYSQNNAPKLNEVIKVVGILSISNEEEVFSGEENGMFGSYNDQYPVNIVPRIHILAHRSKEDIFQQKLEDIKKVVDNPEDQSCLKEQILSILKEITCGDQVLAEYMLIAFISQVVRKNEDTLIGKMILNIYKVNGVCFKHNEKEYDFIDMINMLCKQLLPYSQHIPLTLEYLKNEHFAPIRKESEFHLQKGVLQFPSESKNFMIIDETKLNAGTIKDNQVLNIQALNNVLQHQKLSIQIDYFQTEVVCDNSALVLSDGKSFLHKDLRITLEPKGSKQNSEIPLKLRKILFPEDEKDLAFINEIRYYLMNCKQTAHDLEIDQELSKKLQQDFVDLRNKQKEQKVDQQSEFFVDAPTLQRWIELSKYIAALEFKQNVKLDQYEKMRQLEDVRIIRIKK